jgi:hypothetical protein
MDRTGRLAGRLARMGHRRRRTATELVSEGRETLNAGAPEGAPADEERERARQTTVRLPETSCTMTAITASTSSK